MPEASPSGTTGDAPLSRTPSLSTSGDSSAFGWPLAMPLELTSGASASSRIVLEPDTAEGAVGSVVGMDAVLAGGGFSKRDPTERNGVCAPDEPARSDGLFCP